MALTDDDTKSGEGNNSSIEMAHVRRDKKAKDVANKRKAKEEHIDRSDIERNAEGSEESSSANPELWNIDNCEVDMLVKYKMGGQM